MLYIIHVYGNLDVYVWFYHTYILVTTNAKRQTHDQTITKNGIDIQTISTNRADKQADRVLLFRRRPDKKDETKLIEKQKRIY